MEHLMRYRLIGFFIFLFFSEAFAQPIVPQGMSFSPPATDLSLIYLSNIFGVVDGVLSGSGSQLFGRMMGVFNAAVLGLGSMVIMYTLIVGTLNTAQEGEFLGRHWSSIWIPIRCTTGLSLLIPKASGYSMIQIVIMWIVVQGVGAADRIWNSALDYLNQGGKIVQAQMSSKEAFSSDSTSGNPIYVGATKILTGQVCMYALQKYLENIREDYLRQAQEQNPTGPCDNKSLVYDNWSTFCNTNVPDFLASVDFVSSQKQSATDTGYSQPMPNFPKDMWEFYTKLNGICGTIKWNKVSMTSSNDVDSEILKKVFYFKPQDLEAIKQSRAVALQQMYGSLSNIATQMVNNNPRFNLSAIANRLDASPEAIVQYGVALNQEQAVCKEWNKDCSFWGPSGSNTGGVLFNGGEFNQAILTYNSMMTPVLNFMEEAKNLKKSQSLRSFISKSEKDGWIFAGTYFFKLISLSGSPKAGMSKQDLSSGLESSLSNRMDQEQECSDTSLYSLCWLLKGNFAKPDKYFFMHLDAMLNGTSLSAETKICNTPLKMGEYDPYKGYVTLTDEGDNEGFSGPACSSTVLGYIGNTYFLAIPGQPGVSAPKPPALKIKNYDLKQLKIHIKQKPPCGPLNIFGKKFCIGRPIIGGLMTAAEGLVNVLIVGLQTLSSWLFKIMVVFPLQIIIWPTLQTAFKIITTPDANPIVNLANMGNYMIESTLLGYLQLLGISVLSSIPYIGNAVNTIFTFAIPLYAAWLMFFISIGFMTAFYVPMLPYMIFLFGSIAWLMSVIEAMVAGPIIALGLISPEGEGIMGKSEQGFMLLVNIFLRPAMMIIGFVTAIALTYVGVWILNYGFGTAAEFLVNTDVAGINSGHYMLSQTLGHAFYIFIFISIYMTIVQKSFTLIYQLPDKVLRWIGGPQESTGSEAQQWVEESKSKATEFQSKTMEGIERGGGEVVSKITKSSGGQDSQDAEQGSIKSNQ
jgi:defect in organelle trafficking protein DotA